MHLAVIILYLIVIQKLAFEVRELLDKGPLR